MDLAATMKELGINEDDYKVVGLLPLVYVAWADGKVHSSERDAIMHAANEMGWLAGGGHDVLERWLSAPPTEAQLHAGIAMLNHLAKDHGDHGKAIDGDDLHMLLLLCKDVADAAGGFFGLTSAQSAKEIAALESIAGALDIKSAKGWRALQAKDAEADRG